MGVGASNMQVCVSQGCPDKFAQPWCLKTSEIYSLTVLKPEVPNPGVSRAMRPLEAPEEDPSCLFQLPGAPGTAFS